MTNLGRAFAIDGWMSDPELQFLAETAQKSTNILEVGSFKGRSTRALADNTEGKVVAVDPWDGKYQYYAINGIMSRDVAQTELILQHQNGDNLVYSLFHMNLYDHIRSGKVIVQRSNFEDFVSSEKFDFIFIDAIHEYEPLKADIAKALTLLAPNGILAGHDFVDGWPGVVKAVDELFPSRKVTETIWWLNVPIL